MTTTTDIPARPRPCNGVLLLFLQMPLGALLCGYLLQVVSLPVASFAVFVSSAAFPAWVSHRTAVSKDPGEAVHHLHRYAVVALGLVTVCTVAAAAASAVTGDGSSRLWRGLGAELTGEPSGGSWALLAGVVIGTLVATCTVVSAQVLLFGGGLGLRRRCSFGWPTASATLSRRSSAGRRRHARAPMDPAARADVPTIVEEMVAVSGPVCRPPATWDHPELSFASSMGPPLRQ